MAGAVDQVAAQELTSHENASQGLAAAKGEAGPPAPAVSDVVGPAKPPLEAHATKPAEGAGNNPAQQGASAISSGAPKSDVPPGEGGPAEVLANGSEPEAAAAPREPPTMTGALQDGTVPTARSPSPANLPAVAAVGAPAITDAPAAAAPESAAAEKANGEPPRPAESVEEKAAPAAEEPAAQQPGDKRKAEDASPTNGDAAGKKAKTDEVAERGAATNGANGAEPKKTGRPKKTKEAAPAAGRTARKTRSQGPADA